MGISIASLLSRFPHFAPFQPRKAHCFPVFAQNWAQVGAHARGGYPQNRIVFLEPAGPLWAQGGTCGERGGVNLFPAGGRDLHTASSVSSGGAAGFTLLTHHRPRRQPQLTAICSKHGATCARHVCGRKQAHKRVAKNIY